MTAYYNEIDPYAAQWLRNLISAGHIAAGDVDERSIVDVRPDDLRGYTQAHFFAGIGGWSIALRLAGWPDDRPVWTGSCPCQPFSAAGAGKAFNDERHLWPAWLPLIAECKPAIVFGEQVEAAVGWGWLDTVFADLEQEGYACGAAVLPACSVGAPHIRQRLWFVANANRGGECRKSGSEGCQTRQDEGEVEGGFGQRFRLLDERTGADDGAMAHADGGNAGAKGLQRGGKQRQQPQDGRIGEVADANGARRPDARQHKRGQPQFSARPAEHGSAGDLANAAGGGQREFGDAMEPRSGGHDDSSGVPGFWSDAEWIPCTDGKARPVGPGSFPLGHGIQNRASKLRAYGNAIVPQTAAQFIAASLGT